MNYAERDTEETQRSPEKGEGLEWLRLRIAKRRGFETVEAWHAAIEAGEVEAT